MPLRVSLVLRGGLWRMPQEEAGASVSLGGWWWLLVAGGG